MISASHNPSKYNGLKLIKKPALQISSESGINEIESLVEKNHFIYAGKKGNIIKKEILSDYLNHVLKFGDEISKLNIVVDYGNGVGSISAKPFFEKLPLNVISLNEKPDGTFPNHPADPHDLKNFEELLKKPHGIIFVTGPTGSGKITTLYTALSKIKEENKGTKILTIEDPIEYELEGITQTQVKPEIGLNFARGLRSMLRHDPDIMMVGEVRDFETAEIAIRMALTGHLLFSTLHTNDAASGVARLLDIGVEPYLIASSVEVFIAQRLIRMVCRKCNGKGCEACNSTGYKGRSAMFEMLLVDEAIKKLITQKAPTGQIKKKAVSQGMKTLWEDGQEKIAQGITTQEEVLRVTQERD